MDGDNDGAFLHVNGRVDKRMGNVCTYGNRRMLIHGECIQRVIRVTRDRPRVRRRRSRIRQRTTIVFSSVRDSRLPTRRTVFIFTAIFDKTDSRRSNQSIFNFQSDA